MADCDEIDRLRQWVHDLQAGMYINCVYCGHRYGPDSEVPATMADALKAHIEECPEHPMSALKRQRDDLLALVKEARTSAVLELDFHVENTTDRDGNFPDDEDRETAEEIEDFIRRIDAAIARCESNDDR